MRAMTHGRQQSAASALLAIGGLLAGAAVLLVAGQVKDASIDRALRHTSGVAATVVRVNADRVASVQYILRGKPHTGNLNVSDAQAVDGGDTLALRVPDKGGNLQIEPVFHPTWYSVPAATMAVAAAITGSWVWRVSSRRSRRYHYRWLPGELSRLHRTDNWGDPTGPDRE